MTWLIMVGHGLLAGWLVELNAARRAQYMYHRSTKTNDHVSIDKKYVVPNNGPSTISRMGNATYQQSMVDITINHADW